MPITIGTKTADTRSANRWTGACRLGFGDEARDLCQRRLLSDSRGLDDQSPVGVDRAAGNLRAGATSMGTDSPVSIDWSIADSPSSTTPSVAIFRRGERRSGRRSRPRRWEPALPRRRRHPGFLRTELEQRFERLSGAILGALLEVAGDEDQRHDHGADLEVHLGVEAAHEHDGGPPPRGERADQDQRVHRDCAMARVAERGSMDAADHSTTGVASASDATPGVELEREPWRAGSAGRSARPRPRGGAGRLCLRRASPCTCAE